MGLGSLCHSLRGKHLDLLDAKRSRWGLPPEVSSWLNEKIAESIQNGSSTGRLKPQKLAPFVDLKKHDVTVWSHDEIETPH
jgi:hypothetical protein